MLTWIHWSSFILGGVFTLTAPCIVVTFFILIARGVDWISRTLKASDAAPPPPSSLRDGTHSAPHHEITLAEFPDVDRRVFREIMRARDW